MQYTDGMREQVYTDKLTIVRIALLGTQQVPDDIIWLQKC